MFDLKGKTALVTGATKGIGRAIAFAMAEAGAQVVAPLMAERRDGSIIIISSIAGLAGSADIGVYGISKAAESQLARNLAVEWAGHNIRANCIAPGLVKTDFARALWEDPERRAKALEGYPLGRLGEPEDIAGAAVFLAARAGAWLTGQTIVIDGGWGGGREEELSLHWLVNGLGHRLING